MNLNNLFYTETERNKARETDSRLECADVDLSVEEIDREFLLQLKDTVEDLDLLRTQHLEIRAKIFIRADGKISGENASINDRFKAREDNLSILINLLNDARSFLTLSQK